MSINSESVNSQLQNQKASMSLLQQRVDHMTEDVSRLMSVVIEGNGHSMQSRMALMENKIADYGKAFDKMEAHEWFVKTALFAAGLSFASSIAIILINFVLKK